jgi:hypothetical protein
MYSGPATPPTDEMKPTVIVFAEDLAARFGRERRQLPLDAPERVGLQARRVREVGLEENRVLT